MNRFLLTFLILTSIYLFSAEKYAVIYTELPEIISAKDTSDKYDPKVMEKAWKITFLKWEELYRKEKYKVENIYVLYADGIDYSATIYGTSLNVRFAPYQYSIDHISLRNVEANQDDLDKLIHSLKDKAKSGDDIKIFEYDLQDNKIIGSEYFKVNTTKDLK